MLSEVNFKNVWNVWIKIICPEMGKIVNPVEETSSGEEVREFFNKIRGNELHYKSNAEWFMTTKQNYKEIEDQKWNNVYIR